MTNMGMASVRKVHPLFFMTYIYQQQEEGASLTNDTPSSDYSY